MFTFLHAADIHLESSLRGLEAYQDAPLEQIRFVFGLTGHIDNHAELALDDKLAF